MNFKHFLVLLVFFIVVDSYSQLTIPKGYSELSKSPSNGKKMSRVLFDMNEDSINDIATIIQNENEFSKYQLLIYISGVKKNYRIDLVNEDEFSIYPVELKNRKKVLEFGYYKDGSAAFGRFLKLRFDKLTEKIQLIGYDSEYRIQGGHCNKSYNLITGEFVVKQTVLDMRAGNDKETKNSGSVKMKKVYVDDLNLMTLKQLDAIGSKFETH